MAKKNDHIAKAEIIYTKYGQSAVFDYANKHKLSYGYCKACETDSPEVNKICLCCGQATT